MGFDGKLIFQVSNAIESDITTANTMRPKKKNEEHISNDVTHTNTYHTQTHRTNDVEER